MSRFKSSSYSKATGARSNRLTLEEPTFHDLNKSRPSNDLTLDTDNLDLIVHEIKTYSKKLSDLKIKIVRKRKKTTSKELEGCEVNYDEYYREFVQAARKLYRLLPVNDTDQQRTAVGNCTECDRKQRRIWQLEGQSRRFSGIDLEKHAIDLSRAENKVFELQKEVDKLKRQLNQEAEAKDEAIRRLSELASSKLRDNNPNIADLSDQNRPTKLAEQVSEMYDNEWTDVFDELENNNYGERQIIDYLLKAFLDIYEECRRSTTDGYFEKVQSCIEMTDMMQSPKHREKVEIPDQLRQQIKEFRKLRAVKIVDRIAEDILRRRQLDYLQRAPYTFHTARIYLRKCVSLSWLMCVQDPPLLLSAQTKKEFATNLYREYTKRGPYVAYVVWPALYLHENGPLLCKGVAQGTKEQQPDTNQRTIYRGPDTRSGGYNYSNQNMDGNTMHDPPRGHNLPNANVGMYGGQQRNRQAQSRTQNLYATTRVYGDNSQSRQKLYDNNNASTIWDNSNLGESRHQHNYESRPQRGGGRMPVQDDYQASMQYSQYHHPQSRYYGTGKPGMKNTDI